jgi:predicted sulfurtransferase
MKETWLPQGSSDPLSYTCTCPCSISTPNGQVLLFYRYFSSPPSLPTSVTDFTNDPTILSSFHSTLTDKLDLGGKIRIAKEGFNVTVGGASKAIEDYMEECMKHWSFTGLEKELDTDEKRRAFFKPTPGCACVFGGAPASVRVCGEITPMGITNYLPKDWDIVQSLSPAEFHGRCWEAGGKKVLVDVRNHYESRIGYFVDPLTGTPALRPAVRRFGQWPQFVKAHLPQLQTQDHQSPNGNEGSKGTQYMTYCTGGIRCEKGARFLAENLPPSGRNTVCTLKGGIQAYLMWMDVEIAAGRKTASESLFKGRNYVFDARGSTGLDGDGDKVAKCHVCGKAEDRLSKCQSSRCH